MLKPKLIVSLGSCDWAPTRWSHISNLYFKNILLTSFLDPKPSVSKSKESFSFFKLPDLVIQIILRNYVPVSDKACALSQIPEFKPYLALNNVWFPSTLNMFRLVRAIKPGWYIHSENLLKRYHVTVDYFDFTVTIHIYNTDYKRLKIPIEIDHYRQTLSQLHHTFSVFGKQLISISENDVLVYCYEIESGNEAYLWIFRPQKLVTISQFPWVEMPTVEKFPLVNKYPGVHALVNNQCVICNYPLRGCQLRLTLKDDFTVVSQCIRNKKMIDVSYLPKFNVTLSPLSFPICNETFSNNQPSECKTCINHPNSIHARIKHTYVNLDKDTVTLIETGYFETLRQAVWRANFKKTLYMYSNIKIIPSNLV